LATIRRGVDVNSAINRLDTSIERLTKLYTTDAITIAFNDRGFDEKGFAAVEKAPADSPEDVREHPGYDRLRQLLALVHNSLGFSYRTLGQMGKAAEHYRAALEYVRIDRDEMIDFRGKVLNNLARVLSELGWNSLGMCLDGLDLRRSVAEEVPLAGSYNTLALIYDDMGRYEDAPLLSAKAIAYCRRAIEQRQLALSLRQMAESLRHLAERQRTGQRASGTQALFKAAESLLGEARHIFEELNEAERLIEVDLEKGSLYRDRMQPDPGKERPRAWVKYYDEAGHRLNTVVREASRHDMQQHLLDARINQVRIHYYAGELDKVEAVLKVIATDETYARHLISETNAPDAEDPALRNLNWIFRHLSTAQMIRGWMAADRFEARVQTLKEQDKRATPLQRQAQVKDDPIAQDALREMVNAYALGVAYAELYSPRSRSIGGMQNDLYGRMKKFNRSELDAFQEYLRAAKQRYPILDSIRLLDKFVDDFFGSFA
jgi:tetratricopeptide (TPR) repeat protein